MSEGRHREIGQAREVESTETRSELKLSTAG